jgi:hypothetical protein
MARTVHVIGNGDWVHLYTRKERKGLNLTCNLAPFPYPNNHYATCIVDFKFMKALTEGSVQVPGEWILGFRPKIWMEKNPNFYMQRANQVKEFYTELPKYAGNYTNFSCGHMAVYYAAQKLKAERIHMYGFDSIFDFNLRSVSDFILNSDRDKMNTNRLASNWRPIWTEMFKEFNNTEFVLHHVHDEFKIPISDNVRAEVYSKK